MAGDWAQKAFAHPILLPHEGEHVRSGFRVPETPSKAAGPKEPEATQPRIALWRAQGLGPELAREGADEDYYCALGFPLFATIKVAVAAPEAVRGTLCHPSFLDVDATLAALRQEPAEE